MNPYRIVILATGLFATSLAFGAAGPQSYLDGNPQTRNDPKLSPVRVIAVDGDAQRTNPVALTPGPHWLDVMGPAGGNPAGAKPQSVALKVQPCTYYYLAARKDATVAANWKLIVDAEETITTCDPAEEVRKAQATAAARPGPRPAASRPAAASQPVDRWAPPASH